MPKMMLQNMQQNDSRQDSALNVRSKSENRPQAEQIEKMKLDRMLRQHRSKEYMRVMSSLDVGGHTTNQEKINQIIDAIRLEFPEVEVFGILLGVVSKCFLGEPYEVHTLDITGTIVEHFERGQTMKGGLEKARSIALHDAYAFIEVYTDCCRAVDVAGYVSVITQ